MREIRNRIGRTAVETPDHPEPADRWRPASMGPRNMPARIEMGRHWSPGRPRMGDPMNESILGLSILSALSIAGIHSAVNPSYFTLRSFAAQPEARAAAREGLWIGLVLGLAGSAGIGLVFDEWTPAIISGLVAAGLFGVGMYAVSRPPLATMPPIQSQGTPAAVPAPQPVPATP